MSKSPKKSKAKVVTIDRRKPADRREKVSNSVATPPRPIVAMERRKKKPRRRQIDPTTCERDYTDLEIEFMQAVDAFKHRTGNRFPTCAEVISIILDLGYVRDVETRDPAGEFSDVFDEYKQSSGRMFPTCSEVLEVVTGLGYSKPTTDAQLSWCGGESSQEDA
ncbi:MAG: hypothetical protein O2931_14985 [Planctomycetota bacterium]|nr:hypothetical protein [Planctomycetota bacterium]MDA1180087.1 hypothetical protein [Planctomycetota bacterium]